MSRTSTQPRPSRNAAAPPAAAPANTSSTTELAAAKPAELTISQKFVQRVQRQFAAEMGSDLEWSPLRKKLAQHLYIKIDAALRALEIKRSLNKYKENDPPITWDNVNQVKLAIDASRIIDLELDALLPNHVNVIPYLNARTRQYDVDLSPGFEGVFLVHKRFAVDVPADVKVRLVHETDKFAYGTTDDGIEWVDWHQTNPFSPGKVIGAYGYLSFPDPRKNKVVIVEYREFEKAKKASRGTEFWGGEQFEWRDGQNGRREKVSIGHDDKFEKEMQYKTAVLRVCKHLPLDPAKVNSGSWDAVENAKLDAIDAEVEEIVDRNANGAVLSLSEESRKELPAAVNTTTQGETPPQSTLIEESTEADTEEEPGGPGY